MENKDALIAKLKEYIEFLGKHVSEGAVFMHIHNCPTPQSEVYKGIQLRAEIEQLESASPPSTAIEGKEEDQKRIIPNGQYFVAQCENCGFKGSSQEWLGGGQIADTGDYSDGYCPVCGAIGCEEADDDLYIDQRDLLVKKIAALQTTISEMECTKAISAPTPPAGAEGDGEKKSVHPEDLKQVEKTIREALDTHLSIRGPGIPVAANHVSGKEKAANYLALWMTGFWEAMDEGAEQWRSDFMDAKSDLSAAQAKIAELQARVNELQGWHDSHL